MKGEQYGEVVTHVRVWTVKSKDTIVSDFPIRWEGDLS